MGGLVPMLGAAVGMAIRGIFIRRIEEGTNALRKQVAGSVFGFDIAKWWCDKWGRNQSKRQ